MKGIEYVLEMMNERIGKSKVHVMVQRADEPEEAEKFKAAMAPRFDCSELFLINRIYFRHGRPLWCGAASCLFL